MRPADPAKVVRAVPSTTRNDLYHTTDGYDWVFESPKYQKVDVAKPGFFNIYRDELRVGMMIECRLGAIEDGITQLFVQVIASPKTERSGDVMVSVGPSKKFTPVRHDGTLAEDTADEATPEQRERKIA